MTRLVIYWNILFILIYANVIIGEIPVEVKRFKDDLIFRHFMLQSVSKFTNYHLFHDTYRQMSYDNDEYPIKRMNYQCFPEEVFNQTEILFSYHIRRCANPNNRYRQLTNDDVAWRSRGKSNETKSSTNDKVEIAYPYLIVALYLPSHLFSSKLLEALFTVAPMFPGITVTTINAHKYR